MINYLFRILIVKPLYFKQFNGNPVVNVFIEGGREIEVPISQKKLQILKIHDNCFAHRGYKGKNVKIIDGLISYSRKNIIRVV